ncbi:MAG: 8-oxo-dGTP diphosphatase [Oscillospiraceae bacterium]|nr:8-oxo-dGTP diphosphatase [Oscillospiraceae bacterium]
MTKMKNMQNTTLVYLEQDDCYLMLHRVKKEHDINRDKWIGVGGKFENTESPEECLLREVREETGLAVNTWRYHGIVTFVSVTDTVYTEFMHLFSSADFTGTPKICNEGVLEWVPKNRISALNLWEGDLIFLRLMEEQSPFFSLKLVYHDGVLTEAVLNGKPLTRKEYGQWS